MSMNPFLLGSGTVQGTGYLMNPAYPGDTGKATYSKTVYVAMKPLNAASLMVRIDVVSSSSVDTLYRREVER
jgi:hypothetical protein